MRLRLALGAGVLLALVPTAALAHPLGNFTVNTADRLTVTADGVELLHVVDLAEIPTVQLQGTSPADHAVVECNRVLPLLQLEVDGTTALLELQQATGEERPGQAGLKTTRVECRYLAAGRPQSGLAFEDRAARARTGWREVTASTRCGRVVDSDVPATSPSALLTAYPEDLLSSPVDVTSAQVEVDPGPCRDDDAPVDDVREVLPRGVDRATQAFTDLVAREGLLVGLGALLLSVVFGAVHALAPGHGKTVVAAYLVGQRGTRRQAVLLGATVTLTHTASVLVLGALLTLGQLGAPERVVPVTEVLSGVLLVALGGYLLRLAVRRRRVAHDHHHHDHDDDHGHHHDHGHEHGPHTHTHELPDRLGWRSLAAMGVAGGLVPSPSALVVLLGATALGKAAFGVLLVLGYGLGMAATLTAAGLLLLRAQAALGRRGWVLPKVGRLVPALTAAAVVVVGAGLVVRGALAL